MSSKILILSHPKLTHVVQQVIDTMDQLPEITIRDVGFGGVVDFLNNHLHSIKPNIILTGGAHWKMLDSSDYQSALPIIPIPVTRFDLLQAAIQARQYGKNIAVIHYGEDLVECQDVLQDFDYHCRFFSYKTKEEATSLIKSLKKDGIDAIIGAGLICSLTDRFNIPSVFLHSKDSIIKIMEHVARLETARTEIAQVTKKWSMEFMRHPIHPYEVESYASNFIPHSPTKRNGFKIRDQRMDIIEEFLFNQSISSFFNRKKMTANGNPFVDDDFPYISIGAFECKEGIQHLTSLLDKVEIKREGRVYYSIKDNECHFVLLSKKELTCDAIQNRITGINTLKSVHTYGGMSSFNLIENVFSSADSLSKKIYEAKLALELSKLDSSSNSVCILEPTSPFFMLFTIMQTTDLPETKLLYPLFGHRNTDKLLFTLRLLLDHDLSITTVANHLGTSRQTVYALMERIESLVGLLTNPEKKFSLSLELRVLDIKKAIGNIEGNRNHLTEKTNDTMATSHQIV